MGNVDLSRVSFFILDEADRMLDMGFSDDIITIAKELPPTVQTIMFSATMPEKIETLAKTLLKNPVQVKIAVSKPAEKIQQSAYVCYKPQKNAILKSIFKAGNLRRVIIFSGKKQRVKEIFHALKQMQVSCGAMHSDLTQAERDDVMYRFKTGELDVLVATDIVARGIDIDDIQMVINYDVPRDVEDYVHRIGRTARADRDGVAYTLVSDDEMWLFKKIEDFLEKDITKNALPEGIGEGPEYKVVAKPVRKGRKNYRYSQKPASKGKPYSKRSNNRKTEATTTAPKQDRRRKPQTKKEPSSKNVG
jgi:superfamily II DNA/RNA helicase